MPSEKEKMLLGRIYDPTNAELVNARRQAHKFCLEYNNLTEGDLRRKFILDNLIPQNNGVYLQGPIQIDYGFNVSFGKNCYANFNLVILDSAKVEIGDNVLIGPNVSIVTPSHSLIPTERVIYQEDESKYYMPEYAKEIKIGSNCWIASNVTIIGGVTIGEGSVIGAGSVVTKNIPPNSFAVGNPCKVKRKIGKKDSMYYKNNLF